MPKPGPVGGAPDAHGGVGGQNTRWHRGESAASSALAGRAQIFAFVASENGGKDLRVGDDLQHDRKMRIGRSQGPAFDQVAAHQIDETLERTGGKPRAGACYPQSSAAAKAALRSGCGAQSRRSSGA